MCDREVNQRSTFLTRYKGKEIQNAPVESLINPYNLYSVLNLPQRGFVLWLQSRGFLSRNVNCPTCHQTMKLGVRNSKIDRFSFKCCKRERSIRKYSFFERSQYPIQDLLNFAVHFALGDSLKVLSTISGMDYKTTALDWANFCRDLCRQFVHEELPHMKFQGIIEVDESLFGRRVKHHRGNPNKGVKVWIVGLVERDSDRLLLFPVNNREARTLEKIISDHVLPGSTIYSDGWAGYSGLTAMGYQHFVVNHNAAYAVEYVDEATGQVITVHTNRIEGAWKHAKDHFKKINGTSLSNFEAHLAEVLWRNWGRGKNIVEDFLTILRCSYSTLGPARLNAPIPLFPYWSGTNEIFTDSILPQEGVDIESEAQEADYGELSKEWLPSTPSSSSSVTSDVAPISTTGRKRKPGFLPLPVPQRVTQTPKRNPKPTATVTTSTPVDQKSAPKINFSLGDLFSDDEDDFQEPMPVQSLRPRREKAAKKVTKSPTEKKKSGHGICPKGYHPHIRGQRELTTEERTQLDHTPAISEDESLEASLLSLNY